MPRGAIASAIKRTRLENAGFDPTQSGFLRPSTTEAQAIEPTDGKDSPEESAAASGETVGDHASVDRVPTAVEMGETHADDPPAFSATARSGMVKQRAKAQSKKPAKKRKR